jgi:hypothetical protein
MIVDRWRWWCPRIRLVDASEAPGAARNAGAPHAVATWCSATPMTSSRRAGSAMSDALQDHEFARAVRADAPQPTVARRGQGHDRNERRRVVGRSLPVASSCNLGIRRDRSRRRVRRAHRVGRRRAFAAPPRPLQYVPDAAIHYRYRQTRAELFERARAYGACRPQIAERMRAYSGTQASRLQGWRNWAWLIRNLGLLRTHSGQARWLWTAGLRVGALEGSWMVRRLYL